MCQLQHAFPYAKQIVCQKQQQQASEYSLVALYR
jgi:hypothetical protein